MKNIFKILSLLMVLLVTMVACTEEDDWFGDYSGKGDVYVQFSDTNWDFGLYTDAEGVPVTPETYPIYVKLLGPAQKSDVTVGITVTESTGAAGEWSFSSMTTTIPAGSLTAKFDITINKEATVLDSIYKIELAFDENVTTVDVYDNVAGTSSVKVFQSLACVYDPEMAVGSYHSLSDDWAVEGDITITVDSEDPKVVWVSGLEEMEGLVEDKGPLKMVIGAEIEPNVFEVVCEKQVLVTDVSAWGYSNLYYDGTGTYNSCDGSYNMVFEIGVDQGNWGTNEFFFTRN